VHGRELVQQVLDQGRVLHQVDHELLEAAQAERCLEQLAAQVGRGGHHRVAGRVQMLDLRPQPVRIDLLQEVGQGGGGDPGDRMGVAQWRVAGDLRVVAPVVVGAQSGGRADVNIARQRPQVLQKIRLFMRGGDRDEADVGVEKLARLAVAVAGQGGRVEVDHPGHAVGLFAAQDGQHALAGVHGQLLLLGGQAQDSRPVAAMPGAIAGSQRPTSSSAPARLKNSQSPASRLRVR